MSGITFGMAYRDMGVHVGQRYGLLTTPFRGRIFEVTSVAREFCTLMSRDGKVCMNAFYDGRFSLGVRTDDDSWWRGFADSAGTGIASNLILLRGNE